MLCGKLDGKPRQFKPITAKDEQTAASFPLACFPYPQSSVIARVNEHVLNTERNIVMNKIWIILALLAVVAIGGYAFNQSQTAEEEPTVETPAVADDAAEAEETSDVAEAVENAVESASEVVSEAAEEAVDQAEEAATDAVQGVIESITE
jgi:hypothetical protein